MPVINGNNLEIQEEGVSVSKVRDAINFIGATVTAADDAANKRVNVTVTGGGVDTSGTPVANDYARFTDADTIEGRSYAEVKADLSLEDADINTLITATKLDDLTAPDDNTDLDFSTTKHGLCPKGTNVGNFLKDDGTWAAPAGGGDMLKATYDTDDDGLIDTAHGGTEWDSSAQTGFPYVTGGAWSAITKGIANGNVLTVDQADAADDEFVRLTANGAESLSVAETQAALNVADGADVTGNNAPQAHKDSHDPNDGGDALDTAAAIDIPGVQAAATGTSHSLARADHVHQIQESMADDHIVTVNQADAAQNDYLKFTATGGVEGRSYAEVRTDINVADGADVTGSNAPQAHKDSHDPNDGSDPLDTANAAEISVVVAAGTGTSHSLARADHVHAINHAITDNHIVTIDGSPNSAEVAVWTANGLDGKTYAEFHALQFASALPEQVAIILDDALSADGKYCVTMAVNGTAGTGLSFGDCVYFAVADSKWELAKGDAEATVSPMTGIVISAGIEDAAIVVAIMGEVRADAAFPALTVGAPVFIDPDTAGDVTTTELTTGEYQKCIGWARTANSVVLTGNPDWVKVG